VNDRRGAFIVEPRAIGCEVDGRRTWPMEPEVGVHVEVEHAMVSRRAIVVEERRTGEVVADGISPPEFQ